MKKAFALVLAVAMIASMAVASFATVAVVNPENGTEATSAISTKFRTYTKSSDTWAFAGDTVTFGTVLYLPLVTDETRTNINGANETRTGYVTELDAVKGLNVAAEWETGAEYVKSVEIVKVDGLYAIAITTTGSSLEAVEAFGEVSVKGKSYYEKADGKTDKVDVKEKFYVEIDLAWPELDAVDEMSVTAKTVYDFDGITEPEFDMAFGPLDVVTNVKNMKKVVMAYNAKADDAILDAYVDADITFINCTAAFRRTAEVTVDLAEDEFFYQVVDGSFVEVEGEYDEWTEEFTFKTRTLGNYVISDTELVVEEVVVANPSTGAAA